MVEPTQVFVYFSVTCISAPTLGVIVGGVITHQIGGYTDPRALKLSCIVAVFANMSALPIPFMNSFLVVKVLLWMLLFFGGFILPIITGVMLSSV